MANLDWSQCPAVESVPGRLSGAWVFKNTRLPVATVIENLEDLSVDELMEQFDVTRAARPHPSAFRAYRHNGPIQRMGQVEQRRFAESGRRNRD
jgi:uncharacterized protein (DUF433 family)